MRFDFPLARSDEQPYSEVTDKDEADWNGHTHHIKEDGVRIIGCSVPDTGQGLWVVHVVSPAEKIWHFKEETHDLKKKQRIQSTRMKFSSILLMLECLKYILHAFLLGYFILYWYQG